MTAEFEAAQVDVEQQDNAEQNAPHEISMAISHVNAPETMLSVSTVYTGDMADVRHPLPEIYAGCDIALQVNVSCSQACDLRGGRVEIRAADAVIAQEKLTTFDNDKAVNQTDVCILTAPTEPGEYTWTATFRPTEEDNPHPEESAPHPEVENNTNLPEIENTTGQPEEKIIHRPASAAFTFIVKPHMITLSAWGLPSPVIAGSKLSLKVGARCVGNCLLAGEQIGLYDQQGQQLATGVLGEKPLKDTVGVYWTELEMTVPETIGVYEWELKFAHLDETQAHNEAFHPIVFRAFRQPEHLLTIEVTSDNEKKPLENALVAITSEDGLYRGFSDNAGKVVFNVPKGEYQLFITADDHLTVDSNEKIKVDGDLIVKQEMVFSVDPFK